MLGELDAQVVLSTHKTAAQAFKGSVYFDGTKAHSTAELETNDAWIVQAIEYAVTNGIDIINMSFGTYVADKPDIEAAIMDAHENGEAFDEGNTDMLPLTE